MAEGDELKRLDQQDASDSIATFDQAKTKIALDYAWDWFSYHANQRLTAFHYFLIIVAVLTTGYITSLEKKLYAMQVILGLVGIVISLAFLALDIRNTQLVDDGRDALRKLEKALGMGKGIHRAAYDRPKEDRALRLLGEPLSRMGGPKIPIRHGFWLRNIERLALLLFLFATLNGVLNWCRNYIPNTGI